MALGIRPTRAREPAGLGLMDIFLKLKILFYYFAAAFGEWKESIWKKDLDSYGC